MTGISYQLENPTFMKNNWIYVLLAVLVFAKFSYAGGSGWSDNFESVLKTAKAEKKHVLIDFTGSDWCGWCIRLNEEVFSKTAFKKYAKENLVLLEIDFPARKKQSNELKAQNEALSEKYDIKGFPTIILLNPEGELVARTGYQAGGAEAYVKHLQSLIDKK